MNFDTLNDFSTKNDSLYVDNAIFKKLGKKGSEQKPVKLEKKFFTVGDKAKDAYIVYNKKTGVLSYDADDSGKGRAVEFALLKNKATLKVDDFFVIYGNMGVPGLRARALHCFLVQSRPAALSAQ